MKDERDRVKSEAMKAARATAKKNLFFIFVLKQFLHFNMNGENNRVQTILTLPHVSDFDQ